MIRNIRTKQDFIRSLASKDLRLIDELEVVNEADVRRLTHTTRDFLRKSKKLLVIVIERE